MIGILVVTHGRLGEEMVRTLNGVLGPVPALRAVSSSEKDPEVVKGEIRRMLERVDDGDGVLMLTDMLGDTATNLSLVVADTSRRDHIFWASERSRSTAGALRR